MFANGKIQEKKGIDVTQSTKHIHKIKTNWNGGEGKNHHNNNLGLFLSCILIYEGDFFHKKK